MIRANFHTHSVFSGGKDTPEEMIRTAVELGMTGLGFSEHVDPEERISVRDFPAYVAEVNRLREVWGDKIGILIGAEVDVLKSVTDAEGAEYIIGSSHYLDVGEERPVPVDLGPEILIRVCREHFGGDWFRLVRAYYRSEALIAERLHPTIIGHFDLITRNLELAPLFDPADPRYRSAALEAMEYLVSKGFLFELNCGGVNRGAKKEYYPDPFLLKRLKELGGEIILGSDAHRKELLLGAFEGALQSAAACGFDHVNLLTRDGSGRVVPRQVGIL